MLNWNISCTYVERACVFILCELDNTELWPTLNHRQCSNNRKVGREVAN